MKGYININWPEILNFVLKIAIFSLVFTTIFGISFTNSLLAFFAIGLIGADSDSLNLTLEPYIKKEYGHMLIVGVLLVILYFFAL